MRRSCVKSGALLLLAAVLGLGLSPTAEAQDLEPRRWSHLPLGANFAAAAYAYTEGDVLFDPLLLIEGAEMEAHTTIATYLRTFGVFGKSARFDVTLPYQRVSWDGLLDDVPTTARREGFADPRCRLSVNFLGAPALKPREFREYRAAHSKSTVVGAAVSIKLPLGEYKKDRLLNLGQNRFAIRPQLGAVHTRGPWSYELTGSIFFFTDNDEFWNGNERAQDSLFALQAHVAYTFKPGMWISFGGAYGWGGENSVNGVRKNDPSGNRLAALSFSLPINPTMGLKFVFVRARTSKVTGVESDNLVVAYSVMF
jgi:hypothetical protein